MQSLAQALFAVLAVSCALMSTVQSSSMPLTLQPGGCSGLEFLDLGQKYHYDAQVAVTSGNVSCIRYNRTVPGCQICGKAWQLACPSRSQIPQSSRKYRASAQHNTDVFGLLQRLQAICTGRVYQ